MPSCLYLLCEPLEGIESSLFAPLEAESLLLEGGLSTASTSFAESIRKGEKKDSSSQSRLTEADVLELVFSHSKVIVL